MGIAEGRSKKYGFFSCSDLIYSCILSLEFCVDMSFRAKMGNDSVLGLEMFTF